MSKLIVVKEYWIDDSHPSDDSIMDGIRIANAENCIVRINWHFPYSGSYCLTIRKEMTFEECKSKLPRCYPV